MPDLIQKTIDFIEFLMRLQVFNLFKRFRFQLCLLLEQLQDRFQFLDHVLVHVLVSSDFVLGGEGFFLFADLLSVGLGLDLAGKHHLQIIQPVLGLLLALENEFKQSLQRYQVNRLARLLVCLFGIGLQNEAETALERHHVDDLLKFRVSTE